MLFNFAIRCPTESHGDRNPQLSTSGLLADGFDRALAKQGRFKLTHCTLQPENQPVINQVRIVDAVQIYNDRTHHPTKLDQMVPVTSIACQSRGLETEDGAYFAATDLGHQTLKAGAINQSRSCAPQILINHVDSLKAQLSSPVFQAILASLAFQVVCHLSRGGLANVYDCGS